MKKTWFAFFFCNPKNVRTGRQSEVKGDYWESVLSLILTFDPPQVYSTSTVKKLMLNILQILNIPV